MQIEQNDMENLPY